MRWEDGRESENVEDQRRSPVGIALGGVGTVIVIVIALLLGKNPMALLQQAQNNAPPGVQAPVQENPEEARKVSFVKHVLAETEDVWGDLFHAWARRTASPNWYSSMARSDRHAVWPMRQSDLSTVPPMKNCISINNSTTS